MILEQAHSDEQALHANLTKFSALNAQGGFSSNSTSESRGVKPCNLQDFLKNHTGDNVSSSNSVNKNNYRNNNKSKNNMTRMTSHSIRFVDRWDILPLIVCN